MTLLETLVWISMFIFAIGAVTSSIITFYRTSNYTIQQASAISSAQKGISAMVKTMREAAYASNGAYPVVSMAGSDIVFYADIDSDTAIERVHYYVQGTNLYRGILQPTGDPAVYAGAEDVTSISQDVRNIAQAVTTFTYYDAAGALITDYSQIGSLRFIVANIVVDADTTRLPNAVTIRSSAALRNLVTH